MLAFRALSTAFGFHLALGMAIAEQLLALWDPLRNPYCDLGSDLGSFFGEFDTMWRVQLIFSAGFEVEITVEGYATIVPIYIVPHYQL